MTSQTGRQQYTDEGGAQSQRNQDERALVDLTVSELQRDLQRVEDQTRIAQHDANNARQGAQQARSAAQQAQTQQAQGQAQQAQNQLQQGQAQQAQKEAQQANQRAQGATEAHTDHRCPGRRGCRRGWANGAYVRILAPEVLDRAPAPASPSKAVTRGSTY